MKSKRSNRPIVVGVEDKQHAALRYALSEADSQGCGIRLVHAYSLSASGPALLGDDALEASAEAAYAILDNARDFIDAQDIKVPVEYAVEFGAPTQILEAEARNARALVLGPENAAWYERILAGEVGSWLATRAECPVIVVPEYWYPHQVRRGGVVVTIDGATDAHGPLTFAFRTADRLDQELHVLHVIPPATSVADEEEHRLNIAQVLAGWADKFPLVPVFRSLVFGQVDEACIGSTSLANLVVVGRPRGHGRPFSLLRPVAVSVIKEANCPVAVLPPNYDG
ncbi:MAG: universal stress protein [Actinomycetota bacterium]|nr:universal stress protein [Actinomycetota bacterium]